MSTMYGSKRFKYRLYDIGNSSQDLNWDLFSFKLKGVISSFERRSYFVICSYPLIAFKVSYFLSFPLKY